MSFSWVSAVFVFALVSAISPGPVNMLALSTGVSGKVRSGLWFVFGATTGYCLLVLAAGLGLQVLINAFPALLTVLKWLGAGFIIWLASLLWRADGRLEKTTGVTVTFWRGALLQWLNPKAYLASLSAVSLYAPNETITLLALTGIYYVVCFFSIACWLLMGRLLSNWLQRAERLRIFNRALAVLLALSIVYLLR